MRALSTSILRDILYFTFTRRALLVAIESIDLRAHICIAKNISFANLYSTDLYIDALNCQSAFIYFRITPRFTFTRKKRLEKNEQRLSSIRDDANVIDG